MKPSISLAIVTLILSSIFMTSAQSRTNVTKQTYTYISGSVTNFKKWQQLSSTGEWLSTSPESYKGPKSDQYKGAFYWDIVSFKEDGKDIYAIRFMVGSYSYRYPSLELEPIYSKHHIFYFITYHDVLKLQHCQLDDVVTIKPYGRYMYDFGPDKTIKTYSDRGYEDNYSETMLIKRTMQGKEEVVRFVLPYEGLANNDIFYNGPYYELSYKNYKKFIATLTELPHENEGSIPIRHPELLKDIQITEASTDYIHTKFDTTSYYLNIYNICQDPHYYDGQKIRFIPAKPTSDEDICAEYLEGFTTSEVTLLTEYTDTITIEDKKGNKTFHLYTPQTNIYHPTLISNEYVRNFNTSYSGTNNLKIASGFYTPLSEILNQTFTIISAFGEKKYNNYHLILKLKDENQETLYFSFTFYSYADKEGYMPVLMLGTLDKVIKDYAGKSFLLKDDRYKTSFAAIPQGGDTYVVPKGELKYVGTKYVETRNHHDYITMGAHKYSYGQYYLEPHIQLTDTTGNIFSLLLPKYDSTKSNSIIYGSIDGRVEGYTYYKLTIDNLIESNTYFIEKKTEREKDEARQTEIEARFKKLAHKYGKDTAEDIIKGYVRIGWNTEKCIESWGQPDDINRSIGIWGVHEQWVYGFDTYLYFEDGVLTAIQN